MSENSMSSTFVVQNALLSSRLSKKMGNRLSVHGISLTEYLIMDYLDRSPHKAVPRIDLADHVGMSASGVTRLLAPMEKNNIVEKVVNPRDARQSLVTLSAAGQQLYQDARTSFEHISNDLLRDQNHSLVKKAVELYGKLL
ncbi:MAG TPA: MarR family transcriptional regulator [Pseudomonadaceae bacterium]|nr:MarR family transcriptional regulator [Pseudomonadaceae bacterium]